MHRWQPPGLLQEGHHKATDRANGSTPPNSRRKSRQTVPSTAPIGTEAYTKWAGAPVLLPCDALAIEHLACHRTTAKEGATRYYAALATSNRASSGVHCLDVPAGGGSKAQNLAAVQTHTKGAPSPQRDSTRTKLTHPANRAQPRDHASNSWGLKSGQAAVFGVTKHT